MDKEETDQDCGGEKERARKAQEMNGLVRPTGVLSKVYRMDGDVCVVAWWLGRQKNKGFKMIATKKKETTRNRNLTDLRGLYKVA